MGKSVLSTLRECIKKHMQQQVVVPCRPYKGQFLSPFFLVQKPNGSYRFILNLKHLNKKIYTLPPFKMETIRSVMRLMFKNCYMASIDLKDAYFLLPVRRKCRILLRFHFENNYFEFTCMPFGLSIAPFTFIKLTKPVLAFLGKEAYFV